MSSNNQQGEFINVRPAWLTVFIALTGLAMAVVVLVASLALHFSIISWKAPAKACPDRQSAILLPPVMPIPAPCQDGHPNGNVTLDPDRNPWINDLAEALQQIQATLKDGVPPGDVVVDREKNPWINELVAALQQIQAKLKDGVPPGDMVVDREKNPWINELVAALQQIQAKLNGPDGNVTLDPDRNPWINDLVEALREADRPGRDVNVEVDLEKPAWADDLVAALHGVVELRAIDPAIRVEVRKHMACGENQRLTLSGVIRFPIGTSSLEGAAPDRIDNFLCRVGDRATGWRIFGFASGEGGKDMNQELSRQRACKVTQYICRKHRCESCDIDCGKRPEGGEAEVAHTCAVPDGNPKSDLFIHPLGEEHFINGVADSRSAVIAACLGETTAQDVRPCGNSLIGNR